MRSPSKRTITIALIILVILIGVGGVVLARRSNNDTQVVRRPTPPPEPVNIIAVSERPYVSLQPLTSRNNLELIIHDLKLPADSLEVTLEYDRNKGVLDAVFKQLSLAKIPFIDTLFLGSKSAGGHTTYHDDVVGGKLLLKFTGDNRYALEVPWRYDDTQRQYAEFSTADGYFQIVFATPIRQAKMLAMQSPGLPENLEGEVIAGPYLLSTVGPLPAISADVTLRLTRQSDSVELYGWDGDEWQSIEDFTLEDRTLSATSPLYQVFVAIDPAN
jgi:hypothetical protein